MSGSIELLASAIGVLTKAVEENTKAVKAGAPKPETAAARKKREAAEKKEREDREAAERAGGGVPAEETQADAGPGDPGPEKVLELSDVMSAWGDFLNLDKTAAGQKALMATVVPVCTHFGIGRMRECPAESFESSIGYCKDLVAVYKANGVEGVNAHKHDFQQGGGGDPGSVL